MLYRKKQHKTLEYINGCIILLGLVCFLTMNKIHNENTLIDYMVFLYIVSLVPYSKRWNYLVHALIAVVGFTLLPLLVVIQI